MAILKIRDNNGNVTDIPAIRGKSAYQYAKDDGYTGTEEEFAAKMATEVPDVLQEMGDSKIAVMSQKAVTELFNTASGLITFTNLYNPALQTINTISPHYYSYGYPYSTTQYDSNYNATALIEIEPNTTYTIALIPAVDSPTENTSYNVPWARAVQGLFFYDENEDYISFHVDGNTFTTPSNAKYIRFNYCLLYHIDLSTLNSQCVLVKGNVIPPSYIAYGETLTIKDSNSGSNGSSQSNIYYQAVENGIYVNAHYSAENDITYYLCKKGANNIFEFSTIGLVTTEDSISNTITPSSYLVSSSGDWHAPYVVKAVNNGNGDSPNSGYFTGGNHSYTNTASGVATGRTANLKMYADGKVISNGDASYCNHIKLEWDNFVQGYNTTKADGSGREILREHITMTFDGNIWETETTIYPLEDIIISTWYGLQFFTANYTYVSYIGGEDGLILLTTLDGESGNSDTNAMKFFNLSDTAIVEIDTIYGLGKRKYANNTTKSFFTRGSYNKAYGTIIDGSTPLSMGSSYSMRGKYTFKHEAQYAPANGGVIAVPTLLNLDRTQGTNYTTGWKDESIYLNPTAYGSVTETGGNPCVITNLTSNSITVTEGGTGGQGVAFPFIPEKGKSYTLTWDATGTTDTRFRFMIGDGSAIKYVDLDNKKGTVTSATIVVSADGKTVTVNGAANTFTNAIIWTAFHFSAATNKTVNYNNVMLVETI